VRRMNLVGWLFVALIAVLAEAGVRLFDLHDSVATPSAALGALGRELWSGDLTGEIGITLEAYVQGLALAIAIGVAAGVLLGASRTLHDASSALLEFLRPIPGVALIPLAILAFGLDTPMRRFVIAYAAMWPVLIATLYGVNGRDRMLDDVARTSGVGRAGMLVRVTLPGALPSIAAGIRLSASVALLVAVTVEFVVGLDGIGAYMERQQLAFRIPELYGAVLLVAVLGYAVNVGLRAAQRRAVFWAGEERAGAP
jgi:ABC-type nitrate/sulfonate/bicarbonate transport system permease component